jgi:hypothetical protein
MRIISGLYAGYMRVILYQTTMHTRIKEETDNKR